MTLDLILQALALILLIGCSAFFSSAETALFSLDPLQIHRIRERRPAVADRVERLMKTPTRLLSTILIGNTLVNVGTASLGFAVIGGLVHEHSEMVSIPVMTMLLLIFGEVTPKRMALTHAEQMAGPYTRILDSLMRWMTPLRVILERAAGLFTRDLQPHSHALTEDEFMTIVEVGEEQGVLDAEERSMVGGIVRLEDIQAKDVLTPRVDLVGLDLDDPHDVHVRTARQVQFRYLPVYRGTTDHLQGFLDVPRFLLDPEKDLRNATQPPHFVPETAPLDELLLMFQQEGRQIACVLDEYGGTAGLITRGDIIEEITDDVENEYRVEKPAIQKSNEEEWLIDGSTSLEDVNHELDLVLEEEGADRIAGWATACAGRILKVGEAVEAQGCRVKILKVRRHRIIQVQLTVLSRPLPEEDDIL